MSRASDTRLGLAEFLTELQAELSKARSQAKMDDLKVSVDRVTLEVDILYTLTQSAESPTSMKPEFWVLGSAAQNAKDDAGSPHQNMQHLIVQLTPTPEADPEDHPDHLTATSLLQPVRLPRGELTTKRPTEGRGGPSV